ncbi:hypothetical protein DFH07DRAFT_846465 [Mycena maculata]|uniref:Uncharacterized protein n=1 Tax=Mycena maculata TaxID=230809 RepID=A0AAD7I274_9AGAR|nr:hypothetical protein DFH07DRAFT_846465 [Mycena maculata]
MLLSMLFSFSRRPNSRVLLFACFWTFFGYFGGSLLDLKPTETSPWPGPTPPPPPPRTVTVQAPSEAVTVVANVEIETRKAEVVEPMVLNGPPTASFADNLRSDVQYITSWPGAGFTNDVMTYMNLVYLALLTERVPILPFFTPSHITEGGKYDVPSIDFGDVFDVDRLRKELGKPVLEWWQVKDRNNQSLDALGCWNVWQAVLSKNTAPHWSKAPEALKLDISYTIAPTWIRLIPTGDNLHMTFTALMSLAFPRKRKQAIQQAIQQPALSPILKASLPPSEQLLCFDNLYWLSTVEPHEMEHDYSPAWRFVGQHFHWAPRVEALARTHLRQAFGLGPAAPIPPYIAIHVRHGDFTTWCDGVPALDCFAPLIDYVKAVAAVRAELLASSGLDVEHVIVTSDETDSDWWAAVDALGWAYPDHEGTVAKHGKWYPMLIDGAIQSGAHGFVGTDQSTVSMISARRIQAWRGGTARMVKWGRWAEQG